MNVLAIMGLALLVVGLAKAIGLIWTGVICITLAILIELA